jgi:hypothetical protein
MPSRLRWASQDSGIKAGLGIAFSCSVVLVVLGIVFSLLGRAGGVILLIVGGVSLGTMLMVGFERHR